MMRVMGQRQRVEEKEKRDLPFGPPVSHREQELSIRARSAFR
jgi:hypothetical protein